MKKENRLQTIDGETLMSQPLTPLNFVADTLLSQGLHILAGSPKVPTARCCKKNEKRKSPSVTRRMTTRTSRTGSRPCEVCYFYCPN